MSLERKAWELRLLPRPLYRYESTDPDVLDGALFALVSSAGTDPEIILLLEARVGQSGPQWLYGAARFSDMSLWLSHKNHEVWSASVLQRAPAIMTRSTGIAFIKTDASLS